MLYELDESYFEVTTENELVVNTLNNGAAG